MIVADAANQLIIKILQPELRRPGLLLHQIAELPFAQLQLFMSVVFTPQPIGTGQHSCTREFRQQRHKTGIRAHTATPQGNRLHTPARQLTGVGL